MKANVIFELNKTKGTARLLWQNPIIPQGGDADSFSRKLVPSSMINGYNCRIYTQNYPALYEREISSYGKGTLKDTLKGTRTLYLLGSTGADTLPAYSFSQETLINTASGFSEMLKEVYPPVEVPVEIEFKNAMEYLVL